MTETCPPTVDLEHLADLFANLKVELWSQSMGQVLQILQAANLSMSRLVALLYLHGRGAATISALSEHLNLALGTTSHAIDQLVQGGLTERHEDPCDRRHKLVTLTPRGAEIVAQVRQARLDETMRVFATLPPALLERLEAVLTDVLEALHSTEITEALNH